MPNPPAPTRSAPSSSSSAPPPRSLLTPKRRLLADRAATWVVSAGGIAIIASVLGILIFILLEVWPLTRGAEIKGASVVRLDATESPGEVLIDEKQELAATLDSAGMLRVTHLRDGSISSERNLLANLPALPEPPPVAGNPAPAAGQPAVAQIRLTALQSPADGGSFAAATSDGRVLLQRVDFSAGSTDPATAPTVFLPLDPQARPLSLFSAQLNADGGATAAAVLADGKIAIVRRAVETNGITGETTESASLAEVDLPGHPTAIVMDAAQDNLYVGTEEGEIHWWPLEAGQPGERRSASAGAPIRALSLLLGGRSLAVGQEDGALSVWFGVKQADSTAHLTRIHEFPKHPGAIRLIATSPRDKGFLAWGGGRLGLYYSTSERTLWQGRSPIEEPSALAYAPKADGALVAGLVPGEGGSRVALATLSIHNPHPEVTLRSLFGKIWYEGYEKPEFVWQSSGGTDDFEPKLSLVPLLIGTLKGTFYSLLLAIPLGVFGAMYTSQFMHPRYKRTLKPMIEIMASLPSVVLGFLAGLWLAPRVERALPGLVLMAFVLPLLVLLAGWTWSRLPVAFRGRFATGSEALLFVGVLAFGIWLCLALSRPFEHLAFSGDFKEWILRITGLGYDQRNAVVVGLAMGFAVIPIIFAIAEDAFSNVPPNLVAGSLAMGADRWQTVTRVVLPTASPGIFSGVMIGFGRAVGETMIVLMATGNTPIMDWNPFNGFRTLSANIAVEIPEAPFGGSLYRTLFLAALLLFVMTFLVNTAAELVRQRLRERYSQL